MMLYALLRTVMGALPANKCANMVKILLVLPSLMKLLWGNTTQGTSKGIALGISLHTW